MNPKSESHVAAKVPTLEVSPGEKLPPGFEQFVGMTIPQIVSTILPNVKNFEGLAALIPGADAGIPVPHWAKNAAKRFWESIGLEILPGNEDYSPSMLGKLTGVVEHSGKFKDERLNSAKLQEIGRSFQRHAKEEAANAAPSVAKEFFDGRASYEKTEDKMRNLPQRAKVFLFIAVAWPMVQKFSSAGAMYRWLLKQRVIAHGTDAAEVRTICRLIDFNPRDKAGRPAKEK